MTHDYTLTTNASAAAAAIIRLFAAILDRLNNTNTQY